MSRLSLIVALVLGANISPCAVAATFVMLSAPAEGMQSSVDQTPAASLFFCTSWTPNIDDQHAASVQSASQSAEKGCSGDGKECLQQASQLTIREGPILSIGTEWLSLLPALFAPFAHAQESETLQRYAIRDGPLYEEAPYLAHALVKRE